MSKWIIIGSLMLSLVVSLLFTGRVIVASDGEFFVLFDRSHGEGHAGVPWAIDDDEPVPSPANPWGTDQWTGSLSDLARRLYLTGRYRLETLPPGEELTWLTGENPRDLSLYDLLVVCEPSRSLAAGELDAVRSFIESGCSLFLVAGGGADRDRSEAGAEVLNEILDRVLEGEVEAGVRFEAGTTMAGVFDLTNNNIGDPILDGPFGRIEGVSIGHGLRLRVDSSAGSTGIALTGPEIDGRGILYLAAPVGRGKVGLLSDSGLMTAGDQGDGEARNLDLALNLIAYLMGDTSGRRIDTGPAFVATPEVRLVTDGGASVAFETDRPTWAVVETEPGGRSPFFFRDLDRRHDLRINGLDHDRDYRITLYCYDGWGAGPLLSNPLELRTRPWTVINPGDVVISEVFWGGENQYIELYNSRDVPIDLRGWIAMNGRGRYALKGLIDSRDYCLLSRYDRGDGIGAVEVCGEESDLFPLDPRGDFLILQDREGNVISTANVVGESWPAGGEGKGEASMERVALDGPDEPSNWKTALVGDAEFQGTPARPNSRRSVRLFEPHFNGGVVEDGVRLTWESQFGDSVAGVNIYRSEIDDDSENPPSVEYVRINGAPIPPDRGEFLDTDLKPDIAYQYILGAVYAGSEELFSEPIRIRATNGGIPTAIEVKMAQNYPNPFNPQTEIKYSIEDRQAEEIAYPVKVVISIFNVRGQRVRTLEEREVGPGDYSTRWDGRNDNGEPVSSGSYYYRLTIIKPETGEIVLQMSKKMVLLR